MQSDELKLHIGGAERREGWRILNIVPGPDVDYVGNCTDLSFLPADSCTEIYASHVLEHLGYNGEIQAAIKEMHRVLKPGGRLRISVPDLSILCTLFVRPDLSTQNRFDVMRVMFGGRMDPYDVHQCGLTEKFLAIFLQEAGFKKCVRVPEFGEFNDSSYLRVAGLLVSLNVEAYK